MHKVELLAPAGDLEKLKIAITYGADAVYIGGDSFGMRSAGKNFSEDDLIEGIKFAHEREKKVYVTVNVIPHNEDFLQLETYLLNLEKIGVDAIVIADPGVLDVVKRVIPNMEVHMGNQANTTNYMSANFWYNQGVNRVAVARELSLKEIADIRAKTSMDMDIEGFVHGAMVISYSGRCLLSNYISGRDGEKASNVQSDKSNYSLMEEKRPGEYYPVYEDEGGTFFYNSKDLCMIEHIPELIKSGITSFKLEGRNKTSCYIATIVRAYRMAIDAFYEDPENWTLDNTLMDEIKKSSHRHFTTGFYIHKPEEEGQEEDILLENTHYDFTGVVKYQEENELVVINLINKININDEIEIIRPNMETIFTKVIEIYDEDGQPLESAQNNSQEVKLRLSTTSKIDKDYILRKVRQNEK